MTPELGRIGDVSWYADEKAFSQLASRPEFLRSVLTHMQDGLAVADARGKCVLVNRGLCEMTGFASAELLSTPPYPYWPAAEAEAIHRALARPEHDRTTAREVWLQRKSGERFPAVLWPTWVSNDRGEAMALLTTITDLTATRRAEAALKASEQRWRAVAENPFDFVIIIGRDYKYRFINRVMQGTRTEDFVGVLSPLDFLSAEDQTRVRQIFDEAFRTGRPSSYELYVPPFDRWYANVVGAIERDGEIQELSLMSRDITDLKRVERARRRSEQRLALALASVQDGLVEIDPSSAEHVYSARAYELLGFAQGDPELSTGENGLLARVHPDELPLVAPALRAALSGEAGFNQEFRLRTRDGSYRWFQVRGRNVEDEETRFLAFLTDITPRYEAEEQRRVLATELQHAQRLETIGTLAGGIAHDFNNLLTPIVGALELAQLALADGHGSQPVLRDALSAAQRARSLTEQILTFARRSQSNVAPVDLVRIAREEVRLQPMAAAVQLVAELSPEPPMVMGDATQLQQIVANLLTNALHAMRDVHGKLRLRVERVQLAEPLASVGGQIKPGDYARITVEDQGVGMPENVQKRVFEPFFTTKPQGEGTGLGLAVVHGVVTRHGGHLRLRSEPGKGTTVEVYLPTWLGTPARTPESSAAAALSSSITGHVLCVDDEPGVVTVMTRALELAGMRVSATSSPKQALEWLRSSANGFDVLVTDYRMPQLSGLELAQRVREHCPELPVILVTGHAEGLPQFGPPPGIHTVLHKPFRISELIQRVQSCLGARASDDQVDARHVRL